MMRCTCHRFKAGRRVVRSAAQSSASQPSSGRLRGPDARRRGAVTHDGQYTLRDGSHVWYKVSTDGDGKRVEIGSDHSGSLILHWGLETEESVTTGWLLPPEHLRPPGTTVYDGNALQTPFLNSPTSGHSLTLSFDSSEGVVAVDFVLKEAVTDTWYDFKGTNFSIPLFPYYERDPLKCFKEASFTGDKGTGPELPEDLCRVWAYIRWEDQGGPDRSKEDSDREYEVGIQELKALRREGFSVAQLWQAANREMRIQDMRPSENKEDDVGQEFLPAPTQREEEEEEDVSPLVETRGETTTQNPLDYPDLIAVQAYILWENAGMPFGADFGEEAKQKIGMLMQTGKSAEEIMEMLKSPVPKPKDKTQRSPVKAQEETKEETQSSSSPPPPPPPSQPAKKMDPARLSNVDRSRNLKEIDALQLITPSNDDLDMSALETYEPTVIEMILEMETKREGWLASHSYALGSYGALGATVCVDDGKVHIEFLGDVKKEEAVILHWGVSKSRERGEWTLPPLKIWPEHTEEFEVDGIAVDTILRKKAVPHPKKEEEEEEVLLSQTSISIPLSLGLKELTFCMRIGPTWIHISGGNQVIPLPGSDGKLEELDPAGESPASDPILKKIIQVETKSNAWTLMHRYSLCADMVERVLKMPSAPQQAEAMSRLYIWLRFSAMRQLTWQRNYNTQPRVLSAAQDRLTLTAAAAFASLASEAADWARLMLTCVGRGGDGQRVRDEILNIMHRHNIKEMKGTWMEEWHQKLHNNTTPDDIGICEAFIAFMESNGDMSRYWHVLAEHGLSAEILASFDRAITTEPQYYGHIRDGLLHDMHNYRLVLKGMHASNDMQHTLDIAAKAIPATVWRYINGGMGAMHANEALPALENFVKARTELRHIVGGYRDLMCVDLSLEDAIRRTAEGSLSYSGDRAFAYVGPLLQNICLSRRENKEFCYCLADWNGLPAYARNGEGALSAEDALRAMAVIDRVRRALGALSDTLSAKLQTNAMEMGTALGVEKWALDLFAEEVVRGSPAFSLSLAITKVEPLLRKAADVGVWQVICAGDAHGEVVVVEDLESIQECIFDKPTILISERVSGEEEIPEGVVCLVTPDAPDVLSHVSVRARNMQVLFATCFDDEEFKTLQDFAGKMLSVKTDASGNVKTEEGAALSVSSHKEGFTHRKAKAIKIKVPKWCGKYVVDMDGFESGVVGAKSKNLADLRGQLPEWVHLPSSVTVPFGVFEKVLSRQENRELEKELRRVYSKEVPRDTAAGLARCRALVRSVKLPSEVSDGLQAALKQAGITWSAEEGERGSSWSDAEDALKTCWASKFNDRAYLSMRKVGLVHDDIRMAVLVQRMVPAQYAFVLHTVHPTNGDKNTLYGELVCGLGETLVGNYPGRSFAFTWDKSSENGDPHIENFPSKSTGLFVPPSGTLIFRSDSNGEDLEGYAGAGLFDSVPMHESEERQVCYAAEALVFDEDFRRTIFLEIARVGKAVEDAIGSPQDIEGVVDSDGRITVVQTRPQML